MAKLSISKAWDETRAILARNGKLMATVAAALFMLPQVVVGVVGGQGADAVEAPPGWALLALVAALIGIVGQLAIAWLAIGSSVSVGESIRHAMRRALPFLGVALLMLIGVVLIFMVVGLILMATGAIEGDVATRAPRDLVIIMAVMLFPILFFAVRLMPTVAVTAAEQDLGPIRIIKRSWNLTRGHFGRLVGFFVIFVVAVLIVAVAIGIIGGLLVAVAFGSSEPYSLGALVLSLITALLQAALIVVYVVMIARIYVQLAGDRSAAEATVPTTGS